VRSRDAALFSSPHRAEMMGGEIFSNMTHRQIESDRFASLGLQATNLLINSQGLFRRDKQTQDLMRAKNDIENVRRRDLITSS
jgi:hypothetical protein